MSRRPDNPLAGLAPPKAPAHLRHRAVAAARRARAERPPRRRIEDILWESRELRLAWLAAVVLLVAVNLVLSAQAGGAPAAVAGDQPPDEMELLGVSIPQGAVRGRGADAAAVLCELLHNCAREDARPDPRGGTA